MSSSEIIPLAPVTASSQQISFARVLKGAVSFKAAEVANISDTYDGQIKTADGIRRAVIKDIPQRELANELFVAALGNELGLPVPQAYLAVADAADLSTRYAPKLANASLVLATVHTGTQNIAQIILERGKLQDAALKRVVDALNADGHLGDFYGFDAWIANIDRHPGNLMLSATNQVWLIDHGRCFTGPSWEGADLHADKIFRHRLKEWLTPQLGSTERNTYVDQATKMVAHLKGLKVRDLGTAAGVATLLGTADFDLLLTFLSDRVDHTARLAADALGLVA